MVYFKFPFDKKIYTCSGSPDEIPVNFISFDKQEKIGFHGKIVEVLQKELKPILTSNLGSDNKEFSEETQTEYEWKIESVIRFLKEKDLKKLVISRQKKLSFQTHERDKIVDLTQTFMNMGNAFPNAFAYVFENDGKAWVGAFSEILGKYNKETKRFETMGLAGTLPLAETWTAKEIGEQHTVAEYIENILSKYSKEISFSETFDHISGNIKHLRNDFSCQIEPSDLEKLIGDLHPTPAVCGIPKDVCAKAINHFEKYPRSFYSGYIRVETNSEIHYFVNLRCAEFNASFAKIFVGGGITKESDPEKEWRETELKSGAVLENIVYI